MELFREVLKTPTSLLAFGILLLTVVLACVSGKVTEKRQKGRFLLWCLLPLIDTDAGRENRIPLDVVIPVDREAWDKDYELDYAAAYLSDW